MILLGSEFIIWKDCKVAITKNRWLGPLNVLVR